MTHKAEFLCYVPTLGHEKWLVLDETKPEAREVIKCQPGTNGEAAKQRATELNER